MTKSQKVQPARVISDQERREHLERHIPYRLIAVHGFEWFLEKLLAKQALGDLSMPIAGRRIDFSSVALTNALVDAGLAHGRALCEFLGFVCAKGKDELRPAVRKAKSKGDDFWITDLRLPDLERGVACSSGLETAEEVEEALIYFLRAANKGVAHLTVDSRPTDVHKLLIAAKTVRRLVKQHVYVPLSMESLLDRRHHPCSVAEALEAAMVQSLDLKRSGVVSSVDSESQ